MKSGVQTPLVKAAGVGALWGRSQTDKRELWAVWLRLERGEVLVVDGELTAGLNSEDRLETIRSGQSWQQSYSLRAINRSHGETVVLLTIERADVLLDLDVVNILSLPTKHQTLNKWSWVTFSLKINLPEHCSSLHILYLNMKLCWQLPWVSLEKKIKFQLFCSGCCWSCKSVK